MNNMQVKSGTCLTSTAGNLIPAMSQESINFATDIEQYVKSLEQVHMATQHTIHSGVYTRTVLIPKGVAIAGALIKRSTTLILYGRALVFLGEDNEVEYNGYAVLCASANRKQAFVALEDTYLTMLFSTDAKTVHEAEAEFTDDHERLLSRDPNSVNDITITGE